MKKVPPLPLLPRPPTSHCPRLFRRPHKARYLDLLQQSSGIPLRRCVVYISPHLVVSLDGEHAHTDVHLLDGNENPQVIQMNKFGGASTRTTYRPPGSEPGIDPRRATNNALYSHLHEICEIEVVDYSASKVEFNQYDNGKFVQLMARSQKPAWAKVRWVNIAGISWDVLSSLALAYGMFPLHSFQTRLGCSNSLAS